MEWGFAGPVNGSWSRQCEVFYPTLTFRDASGRHSTLMGFSNRGFQMMILTASLSCREM